MYTHKQTTYVFVNNIYFFVRSHTPNDILYPYSDVGRETTMADVRSQKGDLVYKHCVYKIICNIFNILWSIFLIFIHTLYYTVIPRVQIRNKQYEICSKKAPDHMTVQHIIQLYDSIPVETLLKDSQVLYLNVTDDMSTIVICRAQSCFEYSIR